MYTINTDKIKQIMVKRHWCVADIVILSGLNRQTVSDVIKEKRNNIALNTAVKLANVLEIPIQDFILEV